MAQGQQRIEVPCQWLCESGAILEVGWVPFWKQLSAILEVGPLPLVEPSDPATSDDLYTLLPERPSGELILLF